MVLLIAIATIGAIGIGIGIGMAIQSAQTFRGGFEVNPSTDDPHTSGEPTGNPHQFPSFCGDPHGQLLGGSGQSQCPGAQ